MKSPSEVKQAFLVLYWNDDFHIIIWTKESEINAEKKLYLTVMIFCAFMVLYF